MILQQLKQQAGIEDNPDQEGLDLFAELIVRECAGVVEKNLFESIGWNTSKKVKQHFGVEK